jgi:hypothetical protein
MPAARDGRGRFAKVSAAAPVEAAAPTASDDFLAELQASWMRHGAAMIEQVRRERPHDYLRLMASSLAKRGEDKADATEAMTDDEIADELRHILEQLAAAGADPGA